MNDLPNTSPALYFKLIPWKTLFLVVIIILFLLSFILNIYLYFNFQKQKSISTAACNSYFPFPIQDATVSMVGIAYQLKGRIGQISQKETEYGVILEGANGKLYTNQPLRFTQKSLNATASANIQPKIDDQISLNYYFDPLKQIGYVTKVEIVK